MNYQDKIHDILYDRKKLSIALALIAAVILIIAFGAFGGQSTQQENQQPADTQQTSEEQASNNQVPTTNSNTQSPSSSQNDSSTDDTSSDTNTETEPEVYSGSADISYTTEGFVPQVITVTAGTSVRFVNNSNQTMRVESVSEANSTQAYAFFQQPSTLSSGGSYTTIFNDPGTLFYHNLNNSRHTGTVVVISE